MMPYQPFDGPYIGETDALYLSIGHAQWNDAGYDDLSAKVWRMPDDKWSRMSEELPLHRVVDLCILLTKTLFQNHNTNAADPVAIIPSGTFENQDERLELRRMTDLPQSYSTQAERVRERLRKLRDELNAANL
jgi:hypothetical protein